MESCPQAEYKGGDPSRQSVHSYCKHFANRANKNQSILEPPLISTNQKTSGKVATNGYFETPKIDQTKLLKKLIPSSLTDYFSWHPMDPKVLKYLSYQVIQLTQMFHCDASLKQPSSVEGMTYANDDYKPNKIYEYFD